MDPTSATVDGTCGTRRIAGLNFWVEAENLANAVSCVYPCVLTGSLFYGCNGIARSSEANANAASASSRYRLSGSTLARREA